jgi:enoyl-CoA hydratase/carnithine racemase
MTGVRVHAEDAYHLGPVNHIGVGVHPSEDLLPQAKAMPEVMRSNNRFGLRLTRDTFNAALNGSSLEDANRMEDRKGGAHHRQRHHGAGEGAGVKPTAFQGFPRPLSVSSPPF